MTSPTLYLSEADVASLVTLDDTIDALEDICPREALGQVVSIPKALGTFGDGSSLHALGSAIPAIGLGGFKTWVNTRRGAAAVMTVFDVESGRVLAMLEAGILGQLRTSGIAGVATRWLADRDADEMALVGTGRQAMAQVAAVAAVRPLRRLRVFSPTAERRHAFVAAAAARFPFAVEESPSLEQAVRDAPIVTLVTRASEPFLNAAMLAPGTLLNALGAILPANAEFAQDVFDHAGLVVVDSVAGVQSNAREFRDRFGDAGSPMPGVRSLGEIIAEGVPRPAGNVLSLFKAMGMGISDMAVARIAIERARRQGVGTAMPVGGKAAVRWRTDAAAAE